MRVRAPVAVTESLLSTYRLLTLEKAQAGLFTQSSCLVTQFSSKPAPRGQVLLNFGPEAS